MYRLTSLAALLILVCCIAASCGSQRAADPGFLAAPAADGLPVAFPQDGVQPWESLDSRGFVVPGGRGASIVSANSEFAAGVERFLEHGSVADNGEASSLGSGAPGSGVFSYAIYRLTMGGQQPGVVTIDANLGAPPSPYYVGLADHGDGAWEWHGPYLEAQTAIAPSTGDYLSSLGNLFVAVVAWNGAAVDVVGVTAAGRDSGDTAAPPAPAAPSVTPIVGGLEVQWLPVIAADLAGYRLYWSFSPFVSTTDNGVSAVNFLEGTTRQALPFAPRNTFLALTALDTSGNESGLSGIVAALPIFGILKPISVTTDTISGLRDTVATLTATGADSYDIDVDGDGDFDITDDPTGIALIDTSKPGLIRPRVRGHNADQTAVALGSVSLIISGNSRPVAYAFCTPASGVVPLNVTFNGDGEDSDGTIVEFAWDRGGDGIFELTSPTDPDATASYTVPKLYNVKFRVTDDQGAWDVDSLTIHAQRAFSDVIAVIAAPNSVQPGDTVNLSAVLSVPATGYSWDLDGDGTYETDTVDPETSTSFGSPGIYTLGVEATLEEGGTLAGETTVVVKGAHVSDNLDGGTAGPDNITAVSFQDRARIAYGDGSELMYAKAANDQGTDWNAAISVADIDARYTSMAIVNSRPAISFVDNSSDEVMYVRAGGPDGATWGTPVVVGTTGSHTSLKVVNGRPAILYAGLGGTVNYKRADDVDGNAWTALPEQLEDGAGGSYCSLAMVNGRPAAAYHSNEQLHYVRAGDEFGSGWPVSSTLSTSLSQAGRFGTTLLVVDGIPSISYYDSYDGDLMFLRSQDVNGTEWEPAHVVAGEWDSGFNNSMAVVGGVPVIVCHRSYMTTDFSLCMIRALNPQGTVWADPVKVHDVTGWRMAGAALIDVNGKPGIADLVGPAVEDVLFSVVF